MYIIKKAYLFEADTENAKYLYKHKRDVYDAGVQIGVPRAQLLKHDLSKLAPTEWQAYKNRFHGEPTDKELANYRHVQKTVHIKRNPHHLSHWGGVDNMPLKYKLEAVADWYGVNKAQGKTNLSFKDWFREYRQKGWLDNMDTATLDAIEATLRGKEQLTKTKKNRSLVY